MPPSFQAGCAPPPTTLSVVFRKIEALKRPQYDKTVIGTVSFDWAHDSCQEYFLIIERSAERMAVMSCEHFGAVSAKGRVGLDEFIISGRNDADLKIAQHRSRAVLAGQGNTSPVEKERSYD